jgi:hypothetical protein
MNISITTAALAGLLVVGSAADASAWTRYGAVHTWRGTYVVHGTGGCAGGVCGWHRTVRGPYGGIWTRSGTIAKVGPGQYSYSGRLTGPYGGTITRSGTVVVAPPPY